MVTFLSIDDGVENIGYALTEDYKVKKVNGKNAMGVLSFKQAESALDRRKYRSNRRRLDRRRYRISLLQDIFNDEIMKVDENFLRRLDENDLFECDRKIKGKYALFNDDNYNDVDYYKEFPTIYHLRKKAIEEGVDDIRLLYLVIHHIIKYRGNFLLENKFDSDVEIGGVEQVQEYLEQLNDFLKQKVENDESFKIDLFKTDKLNDVRDLICGKGEITKEVLSNSKSENKYITKKDKVQKLAELFGVTSKKNIEIIKYVLGSKVNLSSFFGEENYPKDDVNNFYLSSDLETVSDMTLLENNLLDYDIILTIKNVYDWIVLNNLLKGEKFLSISMVKKYEEHKNDLSVLKSLIKKYVADSYDKVFGVVEEDGKIALGAYTEYIGGGRFNGEKLGKNGRIGSTLSKEDFYTKINDILGKINNDEAKELIEKISNKIENNDFMPKIVSKSNSTLPYQLNMLELEKILNKAKENPKFAFLNDVRDGFSNAEKITKLLKFRIPYYVGPLKEGKEAERKYSWSVRKQSGKVTPWNFDELVDTQKSNEEFIRRMTNVCTYLKNAKTLPKNSVLYSKYCCLNELNNIKINGDKIDVSLKQKIFEDLYLTKKNMNIKKLKDYLINVCGYDKGIVISGVDKDIKSNMNTYLLYKEALKEKCDANLDMVERIIFLATIHNDSKMLEESIRNEYRDILTETEIKSIKGFMFKGWGNMSAEFLAGYKNNGIKLMFEGEYLDLIDIMYNTDLNLQQIIYHENCNFKEALNEYNKENNIVENVDITYKDIEELNCSPSVKKCVWQTFRLIDDIVKQSKVIPDVVFIESTRENTDKKKKKRSKTRREIIESYYEDAKKQLKSFKKDEEKDKIKKEIDECAELLKTISNDKLKKKTIFLYFLQLGRSMYSGKAIDLDKLINGNQEYDIDHIIPQARLLDDSLTNTVLVEKNINGNKTDIYPLPHQCRQETFWKQLYKLQLINNEKYARLVRKTPITPEEQERFVNRQLVETSQTVVLLKNILQRYFSGITDKKVEIILSKAGNVTMFRKEFELTKSRDVNDFHHACDAYLNIVVGDILNKAYKYNRKYICQNDEDLKNKKNTYEQESIRDKSYNFLNTLRKEVTKNHCQILNTIREELNTKDFQVVSLPYENKGEFYTMQLKQATKKGKNLIPMCDSHIINGVEQNPKCDVAKYGGYVGQKNTAYFLVVDHDENGKKARSLVAVTILDNERLKNGKVSYEDLLESKGLKNAKLANIKGIKLPVVKVNSLLDFGTYRAVLTGMSGKQIILNNANQLFVTVEQNDYIKQMRILVDKVLKELKKSKKDEKTNESATAVAQDILNVQKERSAKNNNQNIIVIDKNQNMQLYEFFVEKLSHQPYRSIPTYDSLLNVLVKAKQDFANKEVYEQVTTLLQILNAFSCNANKVDVSNLNYEENGKHKKGAKTQCAVVLNRNIAKLKKVCLISKSLSGLKEKHINLCLEQ